MQSHEILQLLRTGNTKLALHALEHWGKDAAHDPEPLLAALTNPDPVVLKVALGHAAARHPGACLGAVIGLMDREDPVVRRLAVEALNPNFGKTARERLEKLLKAETHFRVIASAVKAAARMKSDVRVFEPFLRHEDSRIRANTVRAVAGACSSKEALRALLEPLLKDTSLRVQNEALNGLSGMIPPEQLRSFVERRLATSEGKNRVALVNLVAELPLPTKTALLSGFLRDPDTRVMECAVVCLARIDDEESRRCLVEAYFGAEEPLRSSFVREFIVKVPAGLSRDVAEKKGRMETASERHFENVLQLVAVISELWEVFLPWVLGGLERRECAVREAALRVIRARWSYFSTNLDELLKKSERSGSPREKTLAAQIRWRAGQISGFETLKAFLRDSVPEIRDAAVELLREEPALLAQKALSDAGFSRIPGSGPAQEFTVLPPLLTSARREDC
ncbi:MAG: HEAT repeat domain-containing protein [Candidatus Ozemobacteraceae bacterium]